MIILFFISLLLHPRYLILKLRLDVWVVKVRNCTVTFSNNLLTILFSLETMNGSILSEYFHRSSFSLFLQTPLLFLLHEQQTSTLYIRWNRILNTSLSRIDEKINFWYWLNRKWKSIFYHPPLPLFQTWQLIHDSTQCSENRALVFINLKNSVSSGMHKN